MAYNPITLPGPFTVGQTIAIPFPYEKQADIRVIVDEVVISSSHYSWPTASSIQLLGTFPALAGARMTVDRRTENDELRGELTTSSAFDYELTNKNFERLLFINQETTSNVDGAVLQVLTARDEVETDRGEVNIKHADVVVRHGDVVTKHGDVVTKHGDVVTKYGQVNTWQAQVAADKATVEAARIATEGASVAALMAFDNFDDKYLGPKASDPALDNDGNPLVVGALYFHTGTGVMRVYTGTLWSNAYVDATGVLLAASNLNDVPDKAAARTNLGLGTMATQASSNYAALTGAAFSGNVTSTGTFQNTNGYHGTSGLSAIFYAGGGGSVFLRPNGSGSATNQVVLTAAGSFTFAGNDILTALSLHNTSLTGAPTAPTASPGTNTTQLATTEFVNTNSGKALKQIFNAGGTWTKPTATNFLYAVVTVVGAGGGGGGVGATSSGAANASGGAGGGGGISIKKILKASLGATETVIVGAGGAGAAAGNNNGGTGGASSFGAHCSATGGGGGTGVSGAAPGVGLDGVGAFGFPGNGAGGDIVGSGGLGSILWGNLTSGAYSGLSAGQGPMGYGAATMGRIASGTVAGNAAGGGSGAGGCGGQHYNTTATAAGGAGGSGVVIVEEYYGA